MIEFIDWGLIDYEEALKKQEALVEQIAENKQAGAIVFCSHPPVVTLGRKTQAGDVFAWDGPIKEVSRGGRATYHGPSQLVVYPILNLDLNDSNENQKWPKHDIGWHMRNLEEAIVRTLRLYKIESFGKSMQTTGGEETGVWVGTQKVASVGIAVRKWVTFHGAAINLDYDPKAFFGMNPCGFQKEVMVSLEELTKTKIDKAKFQQALQKEIILLFHRT